VGPHTHIYSFIWYIYGILDTYAYPIGRGLPRLGCLGQRTTTAGSRTHIYSFIWYIFGI